MQTLGFPGGSEHKVSACNAGNLGSIPGLGRSGEGNGNPLQYSSLENPMERGAWRPQSTGSQRVGHDWATSHITHNADFYVYVAYAAAAAAASLQLCPTLCDPRDSSPPGSPVPGILQARTLEWVAISFSRSSQPRDRTQVSCIAGRCFTIWATREDWPVSWPGIKSGPPALGKWYLRHLDHQASPSSSLRVL